MMDREF
jgi:hypothetical protein